ncbi:MAG: S1/P1 nuclease [Gemmatimonadota bacterium]|nr:S1/P1 nuclease [Gemmatimonadota bacterium]MDH3368344.1 S1/P1 nuclease [Gemmatimonadota bacterium]MDH3478167.1 S1/P1 nuclease [Gemmatimonadota bacterium]MDH3569410.1 S1/P1 nuclease [Gemmatimonadota bacterium]MDH5549348.1 S1/P1 nuclease [Gemmatimonadota bacterium]
MSQRFNSRLTRFSAPALAACIVFPLAAPGVEPLPCETSSHSVDRARELWGLNGHRIIATIAERHLTPPARARIQGLLGPRSLAQISNWADWYRGTPEGSRTAPWHYVNIPTGEAYRETEFEVPGDLVQALRYNERLLADPARTADERAMALKFLVHFIGDTHQPLHAGLASDRGGNLVGVKWFGTPSNLHSVWDTHLLEHQALSYSEYVDFLDRATAAEMRDWLASGYVDWIEESRLVREDVYSRLGVTEEQVPDLRWDFVNEMTPIMERRLLQAGIRLAGVLNRVLGGDAGAP